MKKTLLMTVAALVASGSLVSCASMEWSASRIDSESNTALQVFRQDISSAQLFLDQAAGYLVFPRVIKVGVGVGAETGEGVLRVGGQSVDYYRTSSGSIGFQAGAQAKSVVIAFMTEESLRQFRRWRWQDDRYRQHPGSCHRLHLRFPGADVQPDAGRFEVLQVA